MELFSAENVRGKKIALYYAHKGEVDLSCLRDSLTAFGAVCYYPVTYPDHIFMESFDPAMDESLQTKTGAMGIREPVRKSLQEERMDIILIPGVAFDLRGNRIGYGRGYYDRYLQTCDPKSLPILIAPAYEFQLLPSVCCEEHDIPVHYIVTEQRTIRLR